MEVWWSSCFCEGVASAETAMFLSPLLRRTFVAPAGSVLAAVMPRFRQTFCLHQKDVHASWKSMKRGRQKFGGDLVTALSRPAPHLSFLLFLFLE